MDRPKLLVSMFIVTSLIACGPPPVTFTEPQPGGTRSLQNFPKRLTGDYSCLSDSSKLCITEKFLIRSYDLEMKECLADLDSNVIIKGDTLINTETNERAFVKTQGDSLTIRMHGEDTLFSISPEGILKKFKGHYFLSRQYLPGQWEVRKLNLSKGILSLCNICDSTEIQMLHQIAETPIDTVTYNFKIDKKNFRKFINKDGFAESEMYVKTK